jgi:hypothetical protein
MKAEREIAAQTFCLSGIFMTSAFSFLEISHFAGLQLKLQFVSDKGDKFRIRRFSLDKVQLH